MVHIIGRLYGIFFLFFGCLLLVSYPADSYCARGYKVDYFNRSDGLPHRNIIDLIEGPSGRLWISSLQGISYFDGVRIREVPLLPDGQLYAQPLRCRFIEDADGNIWAVPTLGTNQKPILIENVSGFYPQLLLSGGAYSLPPFDGIKCYNYQGFAKSTQGSKVSRLLGKYLGYSDEKIRETPLWKIIHDLVGIVSLEDQIIDMISEMEDGSFVIWVPDNHFIRVFDDFKEFELIPWIDRELLPASWNQQLPLHEKGHFFFPSGIKDGKLVFTSFELPDYFRENSIKVKIDAQHNIWFPTNSERLLNYNPETGALEEYQVTGDKIYFIYPIRDESIWIGTINGLYRLRFKREYFQNLQSIPFALEDVAPVGFSARGIAETSKGDFYVFENYGNLFKKNSSTNSLELVLSGTPLNPHRLHIFDMLLIEREGSPGDFLIGASNGVFFWNSINGTFIPRINDHPALPGRKIIDPGGSNQIVVVTEPGEYYLFDPLLSKSSELKWFSIPDFKPIVAKNGFLYGNSSGKLVRYDLSKEEGKTIFELSKGRDVSDDDFRAVVFSDSLIWLGTFEGLYGLDSSTYEVVYHFDKNSGLPGNVIYSMIPDQKGFWLGTDNGLTYLEPDRGFIRSFFEEDGLSHNEFNTLSTFRDSKGRIWMGGMNGINIFDPEVLRHKIIPLKRLFLNGITILDQDFTTTEYLHFATDKEVGLLTLKPTQNSFNVEVSYVAPSSPGLVNYSWYLEGFELPWSNISAENMLSYRNLPPGDYTLKVRSFDLSGVSAANELEIPIVVNQFWYLQTWAWVIWFALGTIAVFLISRFILKRRLERQKVMQLEELDRQKTNLYTNITHEFRTPLTVILGLSENTDTPDLNNAEKQQKRFKIISHHGRKLLHLVNQMMELASLESGKLRTNEAVSDLPAFLSHLVNSYMSVAEDRRIELKFKISDQKERFYKFDAEKVQQILSNLVSNALKFSPENSEVLVRAKIKEIGGKPLLMLEVIDSGPGIPPEETEKIFDRFHRVESGLKANTPGSGIGLALAKELVELLNGEIGVRPAEGGGSAFYFTIPVKRALEQQKVDAIKVNRDQLQNSLQSVMADSGDLEKESGKSVGLDLNGENPLLLLVEDNEDVMNYLDSCIPSKYKTIRARNGREGLEKAIEIVPDIIISDVMMPDMDGYQLCAEAKSNRATSHIPIILLTAKSDEKSRLIGLQQGADAYLAKPFVKEELLIRIDNMFQLIERIRKFNSQENPDFSKSDTEPTSPQMKFMGELYEAMEGEVDNLQLTMDTLAAKMHLSRSQLFRKVKAVTGQSPAGILKEFRLRKAREYFSATPDATIAEISYKVGFSDPKYFSRIFFEKYNHRPGKSED